MTYSQFIHGKIAGERNYKIVAMTADLVGRETELENIAQRYRFWGQQPPEANPIALGVFHYQGGLLVGQAMSAIYSDGRPALDGQGRPFSQHRYIFVPTKSLEPIAGRLWLLLDWVMAETRGIPVFEQVNRALRPLSPPYFSPHTINVQAEQDKLCRTLQLRDDRGQRLLLSALAGLVNKKRVVFDAADHGGIFSEDLLEGLLLLLPAVGRQQVSIAAGAIDEAVCNQASLLVKTNGTPAAPLAKDLIWIKRAANQLYGASEVDRHSDYTSLLHHILDQPEALPVLHHILDGVADSPPTTYPTMWQALNNGWLAARLIPALPNPEERTAYWQTTLNNLGPAEWSQILPAIIDEIGLEIAWAELQKSVKRDPAAYAPFVFQLWQNFSDAYITYALQEEISADLALAEALLCHGLMTALGEAYQPLVQDLAMATIAAKAEQNQAAGLALARDLMPDDAAANPATELTFLEAVLPPEATSAALHTFFNEILAPRLPLLQSDSLKQLDCFRQAEAEFPLVASLAEQIVKRPKKSWHLLPELVAETEMTLPQTTHFYAQALQHWQPSPDEAQPILAHTLRYWAEHQPELRPDLAAILGEMLPWLRPILPADIVSALTTTPENLTQIADYLFDEPLEQISFLDQVNQDKPLTHLAQQWLVTVADDTEAKTAFAASLTWQRLQHNGPDWLQEAISQVLGWQEVPLSALLPVIERLQSALNLPQTIVFQLLEALPKHSDNSLGMILAAYLPALAENEMDAASQVEAQPLWQMLQVQAPKVAQVFKALVEGQHNVAVNLFNQRKLNAALDEAPEYAEAMAQWLQVCGKGNWISGRLLETLVDRWLANPDAIDAALLAGLLQPDLTRQYQASDWIRLAQICWKPDFQLLWPITGQPNLNERQQAQVLSIAQECATHYEQSDPLKRLLTACRNWGLSTADLSQLIGQVPKEACNFSILRPYLYVDSDTISAKITPDPNLLQLAISLDITDDLEEAQFKLFLTNLIRQQLAQDGGITFLTTGYQLVANKIHYQTAISDAVTQLADEQFSLLVTRAAQFKRQHSQELSQTVVTALDNYWQAEKIHLREVNE